MGIIEMAKTKILSVSMPDAQFKVAERTARAENRTMSELVREALRRYEKERRRELMDEARRRAATLGINEADVPRIVREWRKQRRNREPSKA